MNVRELVEQLQQVDENLDVKVVVDTGSGTDTVAEFATDVTNVNNEPVFTIRVEN